MATTPGGVRLTLDVSTGSGSTVVVCSCGWRSLVVGDRLAGLTIAAGHEQTHHAAAARLTASATRRLAALTWYRQNRDLSTGRDRGT